MLLWRCDPVSELKEKIKALPVSRVGRLLYKCFPYRYQVISTNLDQAFGSELNDAEKKRLIQAFYSHLCSSVKEALSLRFLSCESLRQRVEVRGHEHMLKIVAQNRGVLVLTGHLGNWEFAPIGGVLNFQQFRGRFHFIRRNLGSKFLEKILFRRYYQAGLQVIAKKNALSQVVEALESNDAVIFVLDQHACLSNRDGIAVEFFGKKAGTYRSLASFARHTGVPVVPAASYRLPNSNKHVLEFYPPLEWEERESTQASIYHNTLRYNQALEAMIKAHPEQWLWLHKRWKL